MQWVKNTFGLIPESGGAAPTMKGKQMCKLCDDDDKYGHEPAEAPSDLTDVLGAENRMVIHWERGMFWHVDCEKMHDAIMKEVSMEEKRGVIECLACGKKGYYPKGGVGALCCDEVAPNY